MGQHSALFPFRAVFLLWAPATAQPQRVEKSEESDFLLPLHRWRNWGRGEGVGAYSRSAGQQGPELRALDVCPACPSCTACSRAVVVVPPLGRKAKGKAATPLAWFQGFQSLVSRNQTWPWPVLRTAPGILAYCELGRVTPFTLNCQLLHL